MNAFTKRVVAGEDTTVRCFLRNQETGLAENISSATTVVSVVLTNGNHDINIPSTAISKGSGFLNNEFQLTLTSDITAQMKAGFYKARISVSYPDTTFPDSNRVAMYVIENVIQAV